MASIADLFEQYAAVSLEKQMVLSEYIGDHGWWLDLDTGTLSFDEKLTAAVQVLGTESSESNTWLWSWANTQSAIPPALLAAASSLRELGNRELIEELTQPQIELSYITAEMLAMIASGVCRAEAYYCGTHETGAVYVLISSPELRALMTTSPIRMIEVFNKLICAFTINHRRAFIAYCEFKGFECTSSPGSVEARSPEGETLRASFDESDRLTNIKTTLCA